MANPFITIVVWVYITSIMFSIGLRITPKELKQSFSRYALIGRVVLINIIIIPLIAWLFTYLFPMNSELTIGFMLVAVSVGSPFSPRLSERVGGDFLLSASITLSLVLISFISIPTTLFLLSFAYESIFLHPFFILLPLFVFQLAPIVAGIFIKYKWEDLVGKILKYLRYVILISLVLIIVIGIFVGFLALASLVGSLSLIAAAILTIIAAAISFLLGGPKLKMRRTMSVSSMAKDGATAMLIITVNYPEATEALAFAIAYLLIFIIIYFLTSKLIFRKDISDLV